MHWCIKVLEIEGLGVTFKITDNHDQVGVILTIVTDKLRGDDKDLDDYIR